MKKGDVLANKYELLKLLSSTASSKVFLVKDKNQQDDSCFVAKVISESKQEHHGIYENEVRLLKNIQHANMASLIDEGKCPNHGVFYIITAYIDGESFDCWCRSQGGESLSCAVNAAFKLLDALDLIHKKGYLHKDIKPSNILVEADGKPYLLDFGISKAIETLTTQLSHFSLVYLSPEETKREDITASTDIYKLGITLIESILDEEDATEFRNLDLSLDDAIQKVVGEWEEGGIKRILHKMTAANPLERFQSTSELRKDLKSWLGHAEEYALAWTTTAKERAISSNECASYDLNNLVRKSLNKDTVFAEWKDDNRGASITLTTDSFFMRLKPNPNQDYFTIVEYRHGSDDRLKQHGALLNECQFEVLANSHSIPSSCDSTDDLFNKLQSVEEEKQQENEKRNARKTALEQAIAYQQAERQVFEKKRFPPFKVEVKINRGKKELICTLKENFRVTEEHLKSDQAPTRIQNKLKGWKLNVGDQGIIDSLNLFIEKEDVFSEWLLKLESPLKQLKFPHVNKIALFRSAQKNVREKKAYGILLHLFQSELQRPKQTCPFPDRDCDIGFYESNPSKNHRNQRNELSPTLYGKLSKRDVQRKQITLKYGSKQQDSKVSPNDLGWVGHFSIQEESQLSKQERALKALEEGKGLEKQLLDTLVNVRHLPLRNGDALSLDVYYSDLLDDDQKKAVAKCVLLEPGQFALLQGPPGTGKTTVITEIVQQILNHSPKAKVLVASQSHQAVDNVLEKVASHARVVRLGDDGRFQGEAQRHSYTKIAKTMLDEMKGNIEKEACYLNEEALDAVSNQDLEELEAIRADWLKRLSGRDEHLESVLFKSVQVVFGTLVGMAASKYKEVNQTFDYVIVDEAGKAILSELAICMNRGHRIVLVGDHKQLPPILGEESLSLLDTQTKQSLKITFFEELYTSLEKERPEYCHVLKNNYRMAADICTLVSQLFYDGQLQTPDVDQQAHGLDLKHALYWLNSSKLENHFESQSGPGKYYNPCHIKQVKALLERLNKECKDTDQIKTVAVIAPYREAIRHLKKQIQPQNGRWNKLNIEIATVDSFQGSDRDIVVLDSVRSSQKKQLGFITDTARLNVALSRAKEMLWIVGDAGTLYDGHCPKRVQNPYPALIDLISSEASKYGWIELTASKGVNNVQ